MLKRLALAALGIVLGLVLAELLARALIPQYSGFRLNQVIDSERGKFCEYDPLLGWAGKPDAEDDFTWTDCRCHVKQNRFGFRSAEHGYERTAHPRIVVLGDSFTWGFGVNDAEVFTRRMEELRPGLEVVNLGVSGYGTDQEYLLWRKAGWLWSPDVVLLTVTFQSDVIDNLLRQRYGYSKPAFVPRGNALELVNVPVPAQSTPHEPAATVVSASWASRLTHGSAFAYLIAEALSRSEPVRHYLEIRGAVMKPAPPEEWDHRLFYDPSGGPQVAEGWELMERLIVALDESVRANHARLAVVIVPSFVQVDDRLWSRFTKSLGPLDRVLPSQTVARMMERHGIQVIDLTSAFRASSARTGERLYFPVNHHWTKAGHLVAARAILSQLGEIDSRNE